ncbi:helix-turn-helix domain-containing protein [Hungatella effluvii]|uniref:helix-turn-helix domain-containing protein n=1 Tax=Hungatella effluvii TaxID=1096246 RepID=UPI0022DF45CC|nr:helix-turn-helix transcriptional regulator [Hungatella effluvii]
MPETNAREIGARIRKQREALGYNRENLAELADISNSFLADIERGERGFSVAYLGRLSRVLCLSADYILFGKEQAADISFVTDMLSGLDEKYFPQLEELLRAYLKTITVAEKD